MTELSPASEKLLREIAKRDKGNGVVFRWAGRGRYNLVGSGYCVNQRTFYPLTGNGLVAEDYEEGPVRVTDAGRKLIAELDANAKPKREKKPPSAESPTALKLLRAIAAHEQPVLIHSGRTRSTWHLGSHDGLSARAETFLALTGAGYAEIAYGFSGRRDIEITDAGRKRLAALRTPAPAPAP